MNTLDTQNGHSKYTEWTLQIHRMDTPDTQNDHSRYTEWPLQIHRMNTPDTQNEHSRYTGNIGYKTQNENKQNK
jgi:hypothetical protein